MSEAASAPPVLFERATGDKRDAWLLDRGERIALQVIRDPAGRAAMFEALAGRLQGMAGEAEAQVHDSRFVKTKHASLLTVSAETPSPAGVGVIAGVHDAISRVIQASAAVEAAGVDAAMHARIVELAEASAAARRAGPPGVEPAPINQSSSGVMGAMAHNKEAT